MNFDIYESIQTKENKKADYLKTDSARINQIGKYMNYKSLFLMFLSKIIRSIYNFEK